MVFRREELYGCSEEYVKQLTKKEARVVTLVAKGFSRKQIGEALSISPHTVDRYRSNVRERLGSGTAQEFTMLALAKGWIDNPYLKGCDVRVDAPPDC